ncbi:MAG: TrbC/VirB2 family protein [Patescibacteria group bacterium]|nr:TrbC/VirB2 family protein [Patescibacteria group bacterium]MDD4303959.1 TrbC/VirB2 family protein [Patescibacteria group bacterium]MDD4695052.1 TrbC/VirB2 family protein [Patescibacteria group bacterium]
MKNKLIKKNILSFLIILVGLFVFQNICLAATLTNPLDPQGTGLTVAQLIGKIIRAILGIVGSLSLLMFIYGGVSWMTAGGSEEKAKKSKQILVNAALGIVIIFSSYSILNWIFAIIQ